MNDNCRTTILSLLSSRSILSQPSFQFLHVPYFSTHTFCHLRCGKKLMMVVLRTRRSSSQLETTSWRCVFHRRASGRDARSSRRVAVGHTYRHILCQKIWRYISSLFICIYMIVFFLFLCVYNVSVTYRSYSQTQFFPFGYVDGDIERSSLGILVSSSFHILCHPYIIRNYSLFFLFRL